MTLQRYLYLLTLFISFFCFNITSSMAGEHILIPKLGAVNWDDNSNHRANNDPFDFEDETVVAYGFKYLYKLDNGFAFGAEIFTYEKQIVSTANNNGDALTSHIYGVVEKIFNPEGSFKPFVGIGVGASSMIFDANVNGKIDDGYNDFAADFSYQIYTGAEVKLTDKIGVSLEYKYFDIDISDDIDDRHINIESDGHALFVGVAIHI